MRLFEIDALSSHAISKKCRFMHFLLSLLHDSLLLRYLLHWNSRHCTFTLEWKALARARACSVKAKAYAEGGPQVHGGGSILPGDWGGGGGGGGVGESNEGHYILVVLIR